MDLKLLFLDVETNGLDGNVNGLNQISGIIDINGKVEEEFDFHVSPFEQDFITSEALKACHKSRDQIYSQADPRDVHRDLIKRFGNHVNKFKRWDKFILVAYNSNFDHEHLRAFFSKCEDKFFGSWFHMPDFCVMRYALKFLMKKRARLENFKLGTVAEFLGIAKRDDPRWHDSKFDVAVTRDLYYLIDKHCEWTTYKED